MNIITKSEIISIAYISNIDENELKDEIISTAINKYIIPVVTQTIYDLLIATPSSYTVLIDTYIKPCIAFYVKYLHIYQASLDSGLTPVEFLRDMAAEVLAVAENKKAELLKYMIANYFPVIPPVPTTKTLKNGFLL